MLSFPAFLVSSFLSFPFFVFSLSSCIFLDLSFIFFSFLRFFFLIDLRLSCVCVVTHRNYVQYIRGTLFSRVASVVVGFSRREYRDVCTSMDLAHCRLAPDFNFIDYVSGGGMNCVSCDIVYVHVPPLICLCFSLGYSSGPE